MPDDDQDLLDDKQKIQFPHIGMWLARLLLDRKFMDRILDEPILLALTYAASAHIYDWPALGDDVEADAGDKESKDLFDTLEQLNRHFRVVVGGDFAQRFKTGMAAHKQYSRDRGDFMSHFRQNSTVDFHANKFLEAVPLLSLPAVKTVDKIGDLLDLDSLEKELLLFAVGLTLSPGFRALISGISQDAHLKKTVWSTLFDTEAATLRRAFSEDSALVKSGLLESTRELGAPHVSEFIKEFILEDTDTALFDRLLKPLEPRQSSASVGRAVSEDRAILDKLLKSKRHQAVNVLIHSVKDVERLNFVADLLKQNRLTGWVLLSKDVPNGDLAPLVFMAQDLLAEKDPQRNVLVVDKAHYVLSRASRYSFFSFFFGGGAEEDDEAAAIDETLLGENPVKTVWLTHQADRIREESVARFQFHCELKKASRLEKRAQLETYIQALKLPEDLKAELLRHEGLSEQQIKSAVDLARTLNLRDPVERGQVIKRAIESSQAALKRTNKEAFRKPITQYSLDFLNTGGRFRPEQIISALKRKPNATICFYGLPGTGKTQLAEQIAIELGKPLIMKRASELLDMYLGETEKKIAAMFDEAESEEAVLFLDEADTFLRDRTLAHHSWEVSSVNELLQRMERFNGTFICATNLMKHVDQAALRRFTFKLSFHALDHDQRWQMFLNETGLGERLAEHAPETLERFREELVFLGALTPGDFATVQRQCDVLGETLTPQQWIEQLRVEVEMRTKEAHLFEQQVLH